MLRDADGENRGVLDSDIGNIMWLRRWNDKTGQYERRLGPIPIPNQLFYIWKEQQRAVKIQTYCKPVIRYRRPWRIMGRVNVHDKMQGMLWL